MKSLVPWPFRQTGRLKICAYCGLRASAFGFPWPAAYDRENFYVVQNKSREFLSFLFYLQVMLSLVGQLG
ncbi:MAG: hypothetical protein GY821_05895 [Gammaproteobacteria bacterium]|nr:hypothetical protein [Gammaproteobacteria bacterium]